MSDIDGSETRNVLAINFNHDGSAVVLAGGRIAGFVTTERFSRIKKHPGLREAELDEVLAHAGLDLVDIDHVMLCNLHSMDSPDVTRLHGSDLKHTWFEFWVNQTNTEVFIRGQRISCTVNPDHHLIHAAAAFYTSPFESSIAVAIDPTGCRSFVGRGNKLYPLRRDHDATFTANVGYCSAAEMLFGSSIVGAGKVMGLAPYGLSTPPPDLSGVSTFEQLVRRAEQDPRPVVAGSAVLNATVAAYIQIGLEQQMMDLFAELAEIAQRNGVAPAICLSGGTALNAPATHKALLGTEFERMHFHPACGDDGTALGAALWFWHHVLGHPRTSFTNAELMYSTREYTAAEVVSAIDSDLFEFRPVPDSAALAARLVAEGAVVGWFDGGSEIGPRALGHRSIVADPRDPRMKDKLNQRVKFREDFRPFAPSVLQEHAMKWFGIDDSPFMLRAASVLGDGVPAITHVDGTARLQTVTVVDTPSFHAMISEFHRLTGVPMVVNTSLNIKGEPIAETPHDALRVLCDSDLDFLLFPELLVSKRHS